MGDRALVQFVTNEDHSPVVYLHNHGAQVEEFIKEVAELMQERMGDVSYICARFIGVCHSHIEPPYSLGTWNANGVITKEDSHGDAGVFIVNCFTWDVTAVGGYGKSFDAKKYA